MNVPWFMTFTDTWEYVTILEKFVATRYFCHIFREITYSPKHLVNTHLVVVNSFVVPLPKVYFLESSKNLASKSLKARAMKVALCSLFFVNSPREKFFTVFKCPSKRNFYIFCCNNINTKEAQCFCMAQTKNIQTCRA